MIGFLLKKNLYDLWDNLSRIVLLNLGFYFSAAVPLFLAAALASVPALAWAAALLGLLWCCVYLAAAARCVKRLSNYGTFGFADFFHNIKPALPAGLTLGGLAFAGLLVAGVAIPFYASRDAGAGVFIAAALFWTLTGALLTLQFYPASSVRLDAKPLAAVKRCLFFFLDNTPLCVFSLFFCLLTLPLSALLGFLAPGPAGILLFHDEALRLRLLKYDWLEAQGGTAAKGKKIPWDALLIDEREKTGTRTLRSFMFPWKE
jgi:hypothetical protein